MRQGLRRGAAMAAGASGIVLKPIKSAVLHGANRNIGEASCLKGRWVKKLKRLENQPVEQCRNGGA